MLRLTSSHSTLSGALAHTTTHTTSHRATDRTHTSYLVPRVPRTSAPVSLCTPRSAAPPPSLTSLGPLPAAASCLHVHHHTLGLRAARRPRRRSVLRKPSPTGSRASCLAACGCGFGIRLFRSGCRTPVQRERLGSRKRHSASSSECREPSSARNGQISLMTATSAIEPARRRRQF